MNINIQPSLQTLFKDHADLVDSTTQQLGTARSTQPEPQYVVGEPSFVALNMHKASQLFIIMKEQLLDLSLLKTNKQVHVFSFDEVSVSVENLVKKIKQQRSKLDDSKKISAVKFSTELKRSELERLNSFLQDQSDEKKQALDLFHSEELAKKNKEKKLLYFLDYLNSEYLKSDFILDIFQTIWADTKKDGMFYRIGFVMQNQNRRTYIIEYDGQIDRAKTVAFDQFVQPSNLVQFLANHFSRPVGRLHSFTANKDDHQFIFFFETHGLDFNSRELDIYMSDRMSLLSIVVQRWYSEKTKIQILKQWQQLFKSYQNPVHVIDEEFNLIQSNTQFAKPGIPTKCYQSLALSIKPCENCPAVSAKSDRHVNFKNQIQINHQDYEVITSKFMIDQRHYYFMIYENMSEVNLLKSNLIQAEKMATIGQLSNHLAHELNNPLTGLKLYAEMLLDDGRLQSVTYENDMREVLKAISRSQIILTDLNQFANESQTELIEVDFSEMVKKTMTLLKSVLRSHRVFIDLKNTKVLVQPTYLQQILFNLIKNACQAMAEQGTLKIYQLESENFIDFIIEDDGPGIPEQVANQIFRPFFTTKSVGQGTGLGLFISQKLMNRMSAELIHNSTFARGTQFILRFKK